ncbi:MAG: flagellar export protein FliJ [Burkholderiales bacterium]|nr:flagellar export protein FliJ [Burkholderiales bacterium]
MTKRFQFAFLLQRAVDQRNEAALAIGAAVERLRQARDRHGQIEQYRAEYRVRLETNGRQGMAIHQWTDYQLFLTKLNTAVDQQFHEIRRCENLLEQAKAVWMEREKEVKAFETLQERHEEREQKRESRIEQKMSDEWAANLHRQRRSNES